MKDFIPGYETPARGQMNGTFVLRAAILVVGMLSRDLPL
jgi:hypothetical protein